MSEARISYKVECTLQLLESYIQQIREKGDLSLLTDIVRVVIQAQREISPEDRS